MARQRLRPSVYDFAAAMNEKLSRNEAKGGWQEMSIGSLFSRLMDEVLELHEAWCAHDENGICEEAIDVANFAMMIYDVIHYRDARG